MKCGGINNTLCMQQSCKVDSWVPRYSVSVMVGKPKGSTVLSDIVGVFSMLICIRDRFTM